jgi:hypothetical protein
VAALDFSRASTQPAAPAHSSATARVRARRCCCSSHRSAPPSPPSSSELRLSLAQPVLTPASRGKAPFGEHCSPEHGRARRRFLLRGLHLSVPPSLLSVCASCSPRLTGARAPFLWPSCGRKWSAGDHPRHHSVMDGGDRSPELR